MLTYTTTNGVRHWSLAGRSVHVGDTIEVCFSTGDWLPARVRSTAGGVGVDLELTSCQTIGPLPLPVAAPVRWPARVERLAQTGWRHAETRQVTMVRDGRTA